MLHKLRQQWNRRNFCMLLQLLLLSVGINFVVEALARHSVLSALEFLSNAPLTFLFGTLIVYLTLSLSLLTTRRAFWLLLLSLVWLGLGITDFVMLTFRSMPLTASDIWIMSSVRDIFEKYLSHVELILLMLAISLLVGLLLLLWVRARKYPSVAFLGAGHIAVLCTVCFSLLMLFFQAGVLDRSTTYDSLPTAYGKNGFIYSFSASLLTSGVSEPEDYSPEAVLDALTQEESLPQTEDSTPNIIFVQLESFFDPSRLSQITVEENPIPNFTSLRQNYSTGFLSVPCIGAGTVNTEFEVLTGMNLSHFGVGEYPYTSIANASSIASIASVLGELGYHSQAIHNNNATFYDRNVVYENFGFDGFTSIEFMENLEYNPLGWAKDTVLTDEILKALEASEQRDFILTVSVQPHGRYPSEPIDGAPVIASTGMTDEGRKNGFEYYLGQLRECDAFVGELVAALADYPEPTIVVFYGDHLPSFNFSQEELLRGTNQMTEYILWSNFEMEKNDRDLETYQLAAYVLEVCGIHEGDIFRLHQSCDFSADDAELQSSLQMLEYDMIYGQQYAGDPIPEEIELRYGVQTIAVTEVAPRAEKEYVVRGENFTPYSRVVIDGDAYPTQFLSNSELLVTDWQPEEEQTVCVAQFSASDELEILSESAPFLFKETELVP